MNPNQTSTSISFLCDLEDRVTHKGLVSVRESFRRLGFRGYSLETSATGGSRVGLRFYNGQGKHTLVFASTGIAESHKGRLEKGNFAQL